MKISLQLKIGMLFFGVMLISALISSSILIFAFRSTMISNSEEQVLSVANSIKQLKLDSTLSTKITGTTEEIMTNDTIFSVLSTPPITVEEIKNDKELIKEIRFKDEFIKNGYYVETSGLFPSSTAYLDLDGAFVRISVNQNENNYWIIFFVVILSFIICVVFGTIITVFISRRILSPITDLSRAANDVAHGNFTVRVRETGDKVYRSLIRNFNKMVEELSGTETLRGDFISNVSHEFKTPLASIQGFAKLLQDDTISAQDRSEYTQIIIDETVRLTKLATNILNLSKLENQTSIGNKTRFSLDEQIRKIILMLEPEWSKKNIDLDIALDEISYYGNEDLMGQIWQNIINNAIKFTPVGGKISVHLYQTESCITARISDNGIGISHEAKEKIFEKFYQGDHSRKTEGNGLGLALVKRIIDLSKGKIYVESPYEGGVCFVVELPFVIADMDDKL